MDDSAIICDGVIDADDKIKTISKNLIKKK